MAKRGWTLHQALFDLFAPVYDLSFWLIALPFGGEKGLRDKTIEEAMPLDGRSVLEAFAGTATLSLMALEKGADTVALDLSEGMLKAALEKARSSGARLKAVRGDSGRLPFREGSFDRVMASFGLHEAGPATVNEAMAEFHRVLKNDGRLVIIDYHRAAGGAGFVQKLLFTFVETDTAKTWVETDIQDLLRVTGFKDFRRKFLLRGGVQLITAVKR